MNKAELIERIIDEFTCMGSECAEDTAYAKPITLPEAKIYLAELRENEMENLEPDERLPEEVTPELYMEAFNCYLRKCRYDVTLDRLAEFFTLREMVDTYHEFDGQYYSDTDKYVVPTDWLTENMEFPFITQYDLTMLDLIRLGHNSPDFDYQKDYCWYDYDAKQLHSTDTPFADGLIDGRAFAEWILADKVRTKYIQDLCMVNIDIDYIFNFD